jgi:hypothetical protein
MPMAPRTTMPFVIDLSAEIGVAHITRYDVHDLVENLKDLQKDVHDLSTGFTKPLIRIVEDDEYKRRENRWAEQAIADMERKGMFQDTGKRSDKSGTRFLFRAAAVACLGVVLALSFTRKP